MFVASVFTMFIIYLLQKNGVINWSVYSKGSAIAMSIIAFSILGTVFLYKVCSPLSFYRRIVLIASASANVLSLIITGIVTYITQKTEPILQIPYLEMSGPAYLITGITIVVLATIYIVGYQTVSVWKRKDDQNEN